MTTLSFRYDRLAFFNQVLCLLICAILGMGAVSVHAKSPSPNPVLVQGLPSFTRLVEVVSPSVVNIQTFSVSRGGAQKKSTGVGSGFILSAEGLIMTNEHVVRGADAITVTLHNRNEYDAVVVGADKRSDVAIIQIFPPQEETLHPVMIGDPNALQVGEWVIAIGSPYGFENTVTAGIVSAKQRDTNDAYMSFIQSDAAVNPGNSGGPLLNVRGEVVGVNSQIYSRSGDFAGISFAIPIDEAMAIAMPLHSGGYVERGRIGAEGSAVSAELARSLSLGNRAMGVILSEVTPGGPADIAGLQEGDIVTRIGNVEIERLSDFVQAVDRLKPGTKAEIYAYRNGRWITVPVKVQAAPVSGSHRTTRPRSQTPPARTSRQQRLSIEVANLTRAQRRSLHITGGVTVKSVSDFAAQAGIKRGDIILAVGQIQIHDAKQFNALLASLKLDHDIPVLLHRKGRAIYVLLRGAK